MKAYVCDRYGSPDLISIRDVEKPTLEPDRVLARVHAASVNAYDWHMMRGKPYLARLDGGLRRPKLTAMGVDFAGVAEEVGAEVTDVAPGDHVFGCRSGAFAEYVCGKNVVRMPAGLSFEEAAALPTVGLTALQGIRDRGALEAGERVLVNGAGGGVGTAAVQIARALGAGHVTAVTSTRNLDLVRSLGADAVVDYAREDFTRRPNRYDLVLDIGGTRRLSRLRRILAPGGRMVLVAPQPGQWIGPVVRVVGAVASTRLGAKPVIPFLASVVRDDLITLRELVERGQLRAVIDRTYAFDQLPDAIRHVEEGRASGKVVVTV